MKRGLVSVIGLVLLLLPGFALGSSGARLPPDADRVQLVQSEGEHSSARVEPARRDGRPGMAVVFEGTQDLHYYAQAETAPSPGLQLKVEAAAPGVDFGPAVFPPSRAFTDATGKAVQVYEGNFRVFVPVRGSPPALPGKAAVTVHLTGIACTSQFCLPPFAKTLTATLDFSQAATWTQISLTQAGVQTAFPHGTPIYFLLALVAGLSINIMPCVLPVLPLILLSLAGQSPRSGGRRLGAGLAFSAGVIAFFATFALIAALINLATGTVLDLNSLFRYPWAVIVLFLAIIFFGLAMLDVVTLSVPSALAGRQGSGSGIAGTVGMGFFAGVLSTPCSGALLGFVLVWAQTQPRLIGSTALVLMGVGMALPYVILTLIPALIDRIPKPGRWMDLFKKSAAFLLFFIAAKLTLAALPKERLLHVLMYGIIFSFCVWMWGKWVDFSTPAAKKWTIRAAAVIMALVAGLWLLPAPGQAAQAAIAWQPYDAVVVQRAVAQDRPVLLDFMADWCTNCQIVDKKIYDDPEVEKLIREKNLLAVRADTTVIDYPATKDFQQIYGEAGNVPVTVLLLPDGSQQKLRGIFDKDRLIQILSKLPEGTAHGREERLYHDPQDE